MSGLITPDNHSGPTAPMEHHLVKRILASLLLAACAFNASAQNLAPTVDITAPAADATVVAPASVTLTAEAADSDGTVAKVEFYRDATLLATLTQAPYAYTFSADTPGSYALTAKATDDLNLTTTSAAQTLTVTAPVAAPQVFYIFSDQINTAREITNSAGEKVWQADPEPFGANLPDENPAGQGQFTYNPRFPGQYYDRETGLHYNYYRDYDPQTGRYIQSDPIGLKGGLNTYSYVISNPLGNIDPLGLWTLGIDAYGLLGVFGGGISVSYDKGTWQVLGRVGIGVGVGATLDPTSPPDPHAKKCGSGGIARTLLKTGLGVGVGLGGIGRADTWASGNLIADKVGGEFHDVDTEFGLEKPSFGLRAGASYGIDFGGYWNEKVCGCQ